MRKLFSLSIILVAAILFTAAVRRSASASADDLSKSQKVDASALYQQHCAKCHGANGKGIESLQPPDFTDAKWQASRTDKEFIDSINNGKNIMPGFKDALSAAEVRALVKHVRAFAPGASKSPKKKK